jgi:ribonucleoside-diphosphate reductase alpha chain
LVVGDKNAGSMKSGGVARRAAKMVCLDADHPEIFEFIRWKSREEKKAKALVAAGFSDGMEGTTEGIILTQQLRMIAELLRSLES